MTGGIIINPGSGPVAESGEGWTNSLTGAQTHARTWLRFLGNQGIRDIELVPGEEYTGDGRWRFRFRHAVTGACVDLDTHGIDNEPAYAREYVFAPRVYWNGSSSSTPEIENWLVDGFEVVKTLRPVQREEP